MTEMCSTQQASKQCESSQEQTKMLTKEEFSREFKSAFNARMKRWTDNEGIIEINGPPQTWDSFGTPYITFCTGGEMQEGAVYPSIFNITDLDRKVAQMLAATFFYQLKAWVGENNLIIWREQPDIVAWRDLNDTHWNITVRSRLTARRENIYGDAFPELEDEQEESFDGC